MKNIFSKNNLKKIFSIIFIFVLLQIIFTGCVQVKPYQKMYLNDEEMKLAGKKTDVFDNGIESYREGSSGATGGKTGGGCGCN